MQANINKFCLIISNCIVGFVISNEYMETGIAKLMYIQKH